MTACAARADRAGLARRDARWAPPPTAGAPRQGRKARRQPPPAELARRLSRWRAGRKASASDPAFCGLGGARLQPTILAGIIHRTATRAGIDEHLTARTVRHIATTWLLQATRDKRLVAEYLGHPDLSAVARYAHFAEEEPYAVARVLAEGSPGRPLRASPRDRSAIFGDSA
jgi:integrase